MTSSPGWSLARRIGFRFAFAFGVLLIYPFPINLIPEAGRLEAAMNKPLEAGTSWLAETVLGLPAPPSEFNASGDRTFDYVQLLLIAILAVLGAVVWTLADRRRRAYPGLAAGLLVVLRYFLAHAMLVYGFLKIMRLQFPELDPYRFDEPIGELSPMGLLWTFMASSKPYTIIAGVSEAIGGVLLLWRRTATLGALVVIPVMTNVVLLNYCYDVPVKLYSTGLLILAIVIASPSLRRLLGAALGRATPEVPPRARMTPRWEWARWIASFAMIAVIAIDVSHKTMGRTDRSPRAKEIYGSWRVAAFIADGVEHPPLTTDDDRWKIVTAGRGLWLTTMTDHREGFAIEVDTTAHTIALIPIGTKTKETWSYTQPTPERLVIDAIHGGRYLHVTLHREPAPLLVTRGFHWINEIPFNH